MQRIFSTMAFFCLLPTAALADPVGAAIANFGLVGTWSPFCSSPPSVQNLRLVFTAPADGAAVFHVIATRDVTVQVKSAEILPNDQIHLNYSNNNADVDVIMMKQGGKIRTMQNHSSDGKLNVTDGVVARTGENTPWYEKCP